MNLMKNIFGDDSLTDDKYIALTMLGAAKASAGAYFAATLESATPELRHLYSGHCTSIVAAHEGLTALCIERGWYSAYGSPQSTLKEVVSDSLKLIQPHS